MTYPTLQKLTEATKVLPSDSLPFHVQHWLETHAPKQLAYYNANREGLLFRGREGRSAKPNIYEPRNSYRDSKDATNLYKMLLNVANPDWPSRDYAIICSTDEETASAYGDTHIVIPADDQLLAVSHYSDVAEQGADEIADGQLAFATRRAVAALCQQNPTDSQEIADLIYKKLDAFSSEIFGVNPRDPETFTKINQRAAQIAQAIMSVTNTNEEAAAAAIEELEAHGTRPASTWLLACIQSGRVKTKLLSHIAKDDAFDFSKHASKMTAADLVAKGPGGSQEVWFIGPYVMFPL